MKTKKHIFIFPLVFIFLLSGILLNTATANSKSISRELQGLWELTEYYSFDEETNRYGRQEWGGMGGTPYIAFSNEHICPWGTISVGKMALADPCETGFFPFKIKKDLVTIERYNKPPLKWRFSLKNKILEINDLSVDPIYGTPEQKLKFIYKKTDLEPPKLESGEEKLLSAPARISNLQILFITAHSATIIWATDKPSDSSIQYRLSKKGSAIFDSKDLVTEHTLTLDNLEGNKTYSFFVQSCNRGGCISNESENLSFTTLQKSGKFKKIECQGGILEVPSDRWLIFLSVSESVIAEFLELGINDQAFEITGYTGETDFSYRVLSKEGNKIKIGPTLKLWAPSAGGKSWLVFIDPYDIGDIARKTGESKHIIWKGEKLAESKVELSCNGMPFAGTGKLLTSYETSKLPFKKRLQGVWQLEKELKSEPTGFRKMHTTDVTEESEMPYIIFQNNKVCFGEYPCPNGKFFPFTVSKQNPLTMIKTPNGVTLIIKTPQEKLRWGFDLQEDISAEETILHIYQNKSISQIFKRIEEAVPEITPVSSLMSPPTPDIPLPLKPADFPSPPTNIPPPPPPFLPPPAPAPTSLP